MNNKLFLIFGFVFILGLVNVNAGYTFEQYNATGNGDAIAYDDGNSIFNNISIWYSPNSNFTVSNITFELKVGQSFSFAHGFVNLVLYYGNATGAPLNNTIVGISDKFDLSSLTGGQNPNPFINHTFIMNSTLGILKNQNYSIVVNNSDDPGSSFWVALKHNTSANGIRWGVNRDYTNVGGSGLLGWQNTYPNATPSMIVQGLTPAVFNFNVTVYNFWNSSNLTNGSVLVVGQGVNQIFSTDVTHNNITVVFSDIIPNNNYNVTVYNPDYINKTFINYNMTNLNISLYQTIVNFTVFDYNNNFNKTNFTIYLNRTFACYAPDLNCTAYPNAGNYSNTTVISNGSSFFTTNVSTNFSRLTINNVTINVSSVINVTFSLQHALNLQYLDNFSVYLNGVNACNSLIGQYNCSAKPSNIGLNNVTIVKTNYSNVTTQTSFTSDPFQSYTYSIYPIANFVFYDEKTGGAFNMSSASSITLNVYCPSNTLSTVVPTNGFNNTVNASLNCSFKNIGVSVYYGTTSYFRNLYYPTYVSNFTNIPVYLLNLNPSSGVVGSNVDFTLDDTLSQFPNKALIINKYIGTDYVQITGGVLELTTGRLTTYLMQNGIYTIDLYSNDVFVKQLGSYTANTGGVISLRLYDIFFGANPNSFDSNVDYSIYNDNSTGDNFAIGNYNDTGSGTSKLIYRVYQDSLSGSLLNTQISTANNVQFLFNTTPYTSSTLICLLNISAYGKNVPYIKTCNVPSVTPTVQTDFLQYVNPQVINWFFIILITVLALYSTVRTSNIMVFIILALAAMFTLFGWFSLGTKVKMYSGIIAFGFVVSLISYLTDRNREQN